jgi:cystathionine beta-lyase/cystathionine gamma-synthase
MEERCRKAERFRLSQQAAGPRNFCFLVFALGVRPCAVKKAIEPSTKAIWIDTPANPLMNLVDLAGIAEIGRERGLITICDKTFLWMVIRK